MLEYEVTMHYLGKYLPTNGHILDIGGGSGRYCIDLASKGYRVTLADISNELLTLAKVEFRKTGIEENVAWVYLAGAQNLSIFEDETFDGVLAFGPIYHIIGESDRDKAMNEIVRVAKEGAPVFASGIGLFGVYKKLLIFPKYEHEFTDKDYLEMFERGSIGRNGIKTPSAFPDACFCTPEQLKELTEKQISYQFLAEEVI